MVPGAEVAAAGVLVLGVVGSAGLGCRLVGEAVAIGVAAGAVGLMAVAAAVPLPAAAAAGAGGDRSEVAARGAVEPGLRVFISSSPTRLRGRLAARSRTR